MKICLETDCAKNYSMIPQMSIFFFDLCRQNDKIPTFREESQWIWQKKKKSGPLFVGRFFL